jgi:hypothetical protein
VPGCSLRRLLFPLERAYAEILDAFEHPGIGFHMQSLVTHLPGPGCLHLVRSRDNSLIATVVTRLSPSDTGALAVGQCAVQLLKGQNTTVSAGKLTNYVPAGLRRILTSMYWTPQLSAA